MNWLGQIDGQDVCTKWTSPPPDTRSGLCDFVQMFEPEPVLNPHASFHIPRCMSHAGFHLEWEFRAGDCCSDEPPRAQQRLAAMHAPVAPYGRVRSEISIWSAV
jgi:hypothetical protein